jgi:hypothetical protein
MRNNNDLTYKQMFLYGLLVEGMVVAIQFIYLNIFESNNPDVASGFTTDYMKARGFFIFQVLGFFIYATAVFLLLKKLQGNYLFKILTFLIAGALVELSFYLLIQANYEGLFLYSILDKVVGAALGAIFYYYTHANKISTD